MKILLISDLCGNFDFLLQKLEQFSSKNINFDFILCSGTTIPPEGNINDLIVDKKQLLVPVYFIESGDMAICLH